MDSLEYKLLILYLLPQTMTNFELNVHENKLDAKVRSCANGLGIKIASMARGGALHKAFLEKNVRPGIADKLVVVNGQDVSGLTPGKVLDILSAELNGVEDVVLGFTRHHSGILLNPIDARAPYLVAHG